MEKCKIIEKSEIAAKWYWFQVTKQNLGLYILKTFCKAKLELAITQTFLVHIKVFVQMLRGAIHTEIATVNVDMAFPDCWV